MTPTQPRTLRCRAALGALLLLGAIPAGLSARSGDGPVETGLYVPAQRWALVIGASGYRNLGQLAFAERDATAFTETLVGRFGFQPDGIRLLTDSAEDPDLRPTAGNMFLALRRLLADPRRQETDLFVFYFAGHGIGDEVGDFLLPLDGALETVHDVGLSVDAVLDELTSAGMKNVLFVVDGCRTGNRNTFGAELWRRAEAANLSVVLSCEPGEQAYEDRRLGGGVFTHFLVEALEDPALVDHASGALWASGVARATRERVEAWTSRGFDGAQVPQVWTDPTRDVLLGATLPRGATPTVNAFLESTAELSQDRYLAAVGQYAEALFVEARYAECAELLKAAEQLADLPPQLLYLFADSLQATGRLAEMARVQDELRSADPNSFYTLTAIAHDLSGETSASERYLASRELLETYGVRTEDLALLVAFNLCTGGPPEEARALLADMLPRFQPGTRAAAYARYMALLLDGDLDAALQLLEDAEELPGDYPGNWRLRVEQRGMLAEAGRNEELEALYDRCIEDWPESGEWLAQRALFRFQDLRWGEALADARTALERPMDPWAILIAVRAAGIDSPELHDRLRELATAAPLSWMVQLALAMTTLDSRESHQAALDAAKRLAPNLGTWSATVAQIQYERALEAHARGLLGDVEFSDVRYDLLGILAERAAQLEQANGWPLLCKLAGACSRATQLADLIDLHLGSAIADGRVERSLVGDLTTAFLDAGRLERAREVAALAAPGSSLARSWPWLEAAWLALAQRPGEARACVEGAPPPGRTLAGSAPFLLALLDAQGNDPDAARARLAALPTPREGDALPRVLAGSAWEVLGETQRADELIRPVLQRSGAPAFFARAAAWRLLAARRLAPEDQAFLAFAAGRDGLGNPLVRELSYATAPSLDPFLGTIEFDLAGGDGGLDVNGGTLLLTVRRGGKVNGTIELPGTGDEQAGGDAGEVWSLRGTIDAYGNLTADLLGADRKATVSTKLPPPDVWDSCVPLREHGLLLYAADEQALVSGWLAFLRP